MSLWYIHIHRRKRENFCQWSVNDCVIVIMLFIGEGDINTVSGKLVSCVVVSVIVSTFTYIEKKRELLSVVSK